MECNADAVPGSQQVLAGVWHCPTVIYPGRGKGPITMTSFLLEKAEARDLAECLNEAADRADALATTP